MMTMIMMKMVVVMTMMLVMTMMMTVLVMTMMIDLFHGHVGFVLLQVPRAGYLAPIPFILQYRLIVIDWLKLRRLWCRYFLCRCRLTRRVGWKPLCRWRLTRRAGWKPAPRPQENPVEAQPL